MKIKITLRTAIRSDYLTELLGLNPWCLNSGADGDDYIEVEVTEKVLKEIQWQIPTK